MKDTKLWALIRDTRPTEQVKMRAYDAYWLTSLSRLTNETFSCGFNDKGVRFIATYCIVKDKIRCTLSPETAGKVQRHLTTWSWLKLEPKLSKETGSEPVIDLTPVEAVS